MTVAPGELLLAKSSGNLLVPGTELRAPVCKTGVPDFELILLTKSGLKSVHKLNPSLSTPV